MAGEDPRRWMWGDALELLARADRLHRQVFELGASHMRQACWEPPVDVLETEREVVVIAALPGVGDGSLSLAIEGPSLFIRGERTLPKELHAAMIHRMELPQGCFERRVPLPPGRYDQVRHQTRDGCLVVSLRKLAQGG
ncbi:MAG: Hsp20/alpha crystallin family protein [Caulobacteraceae bacterium]|nr:Hsp20/alpha crystallin family protein [Caulobacteraceae bacterium]